MSDKSKVVFRKFKDGDVIAIFPEIAGTQDISTCSSYMHVGQHGACRVDIVKTTKLATNKESAALYTELQSIGYLLHEVKRIRYSHQKKRAA